MRPFLVVADLTTDQLEKFAVLSVDPSKREGDGCSAVVVSLHHTRAEADQATQEQQP